MRYPNRRYGDPAQVAYYAMGMSEADLARVLRRSQRCVHDWLTGRTKVPWWVPELLRLRHMEYSERLRQMNMVPVMRRFGIVSGNVIEFRQPAEKLPPQPWDLRRDDFDQAEQMG